VKVTLCMLNVKKVIPILVLAILFFIPFNSAFAYSGGLLNGKTATTSSGVTHYVNGSSDLTDNNTVTAGRFSNSTAFVEYVLTSPTDIDRTYHDTYGFIKVEFYDSENSLITSKSLGGSNSNRNYGITSFAEVLNVKKVKVLKSGAESFTDLAEFDVFGPIPKVKTDVTNVNVNTVTINSGNLTWVNPTGYSGVTYNGAKIYLNGILKASSTATNTSYPLTDLTPDTTYTVKVTGTYSDGTETLGKEVNFKTLPVPDTTPPSKPTGLIADFDGSNINLSFNENTESDLDHYNIYRNDVKLESVTTNSYIDSSVTDGKTYTYKVTAVDTKGNESSKSEPTSITIAEKFEMNFVPNADAILVQVSGGKAPFTVKWATDKTKTFSGTSYTITGLTLNTDYVVTVTDANGAVATKSINTGSIKKYLPPNMPSIVELFQKMLDSFGTAGTIALAIIGGAIALGIITVLGMFGWRTFKKWLASAK
jgi:hypothetical protein